MKKLKFSDVFNNYEYYGCVIRFDFDTDSKLYLLVQDGIVSMNVYHTWKFIPYTRDSCIMNTGVTVIKNLRDDLAVL